MIDSRFISVDGVAALISYRDGLEGGNRAVVVVGRVRYRVRFVTVVRAMRYVLSVRARRLALPAV